MLDIKVTITGDTAVISNLDRFIEKAPGAVNRALSRIARDVERIAFDLLSGSGAQGEYSSTGRWKKREESVSAGGYPVPVRKGHLRRMLDWLKPGQTKTHAIGTFTAGENEVIVYDAAEYADVIHEGRGSSEKFGERPYLTDALQRFSSPSGQGFGSGRITDILEEELGSLM